MTLGNWYNAHIHQGCCLIFGIWTYKYSTEITLMHLFKRNTKSSLLLNFIFWLLFLIIVCITLLSLASSFGWNVLLELFSHFKLQYLILNILLFCLLLLTRNKLFIIISIFCLAILIAEIITWHIPQTALPVNTSANLRVLSSNVNTKNQSYSKVLSLVRQEQPDIALFMEIDESWAKQLNSLRDSLPYSIVKANPYNLGIAVYSKRKLENASAEFFGATNNPTIVGNLTINGQVVSLIGTHPPPPKPGLLFQTRNKQLDQISQYIKSRSNTVVMVGDLNITMWSRYYKRFISTTRLKNARQGFGTLPTWPTKTNYPPYSRIPSLVTWLLSIPIDHCLISPDIKVVNIRTGPNVGSDHRPLITDLIIPEKKG